MSHYYLLKTNEVIINEVWKPEPMARVWHNFIFILLVNFFIGLLEIKKTKLKLNEIHSCGIQIYFQNIIDYAIESTLRLRYP